MGVGRGERGGMPVVVVLVALVVLSRNRLKDVNGLVAE